jgi:hypothetical protein
MRRLRHTLVHIALVAMILRAFLPTGWMPNPQGPAEGAFVVCTMDGPVQTIDGKALPGKDDPRAHETCPFAAAASVAPLVDFTRLAAPQLSRSPAPRTLTAQLNAGASPFARPSPRAPPTLT